MKNRLVVSISNKINRKKMFKFATFAIIAGLVVTPMLASAKEVIIDVRTPEEYQVGHPNGAINIPHSTIVSTIASKGVSKSDSIKIYSRSGNRADSAKTALQSAGYSNVSVQQ